MLMTESQPDIEALRSAKRALLEKYGDCPWFRGVGIGPSGSGMSLRLNVDPRVEVADAEIPKSFRGYAIDIVYIGDYEPRPE